MAYSIVKHHYDGFLISQRLDGFVNLTQMARVKGKRIGDYLGLPSTRGYIEALAKHLNKLPENLVVTVEGRNGGTWGHIQIAIDLAQWISHEFRIWANETLQREIAKTDPNLDRVLDIPAPYTPAFESLFESEVERITGLHKNDIRNGRFYWEFVYYWLTTEERLRLDAINPVLPNGRRKYKIHQCLLPETKARLAPFQIKLIGKMESCNTVSELRRMMQRTIGVDQPNLFDGLDFNQLSAG